MQLSGRATPDPEVGRAADSRQSGADQRPDLEDEPRDLDGLRLRRAAIRAGLREGAGW